MKTLIKNGLVIDPIQNINEVSDILIQGKKVVKVSRDISVPADKIIDAKNKIVIPGLIDMHVHLREPGREDKETVASGTKAALQGGVTSVLAMPNTMPAIDTLENVKILKAIIDKSAYVNVYICAAMTRGRRGAEVTDIAAMKKEGIIAISDDGSSVDDETILLSALKIAKKSGVVAICHCEDKSLSNSGVVNLGIISTKLGLRGISRESEYRRVERDIALAKKSGAHIHIAHVSCRESVEIIAKAKKKGIFVTAETAPHYFSLTQDSVSGYDTNMKINPPLRAKEDVEAIKESLRSGVIDAIASDHAPHTINEKDIEFDRAEFGTIGLETILSISITELIEKKILDWPALVEKLVVNPAKILNIEKGSLRPGDDADVIIVSQEKEWVVEKDNLVSKSKNSAFLGRKLKGVVDYTIFSGNIAYQR